MFIYSYIFFCIVLNAAFPKHLLEIPGTNHNRIKLFMKQIITLYTFYIRSQPGGTKNRYKSIVSTSERR